nr:MAG TPA: hypothetical protein [Caudoviricetes sp.]
MSMSILCCTNKCSHYNSSYCSFDFIIYVFLKNGHKKILQLTCDFLTN